MPSRSKVFLDFVGHLVPGVALSVGRLEVIVDVLKIDLVRFPPQRGMGLLSKISRLFSRNSRIQSGSSFISEICCDDFRVDAFAGLEDRLCIGMEVVLVDVGKAELAVVADERGHG